MYRFEISTRENTSWKKKASKSKRVTSHENNFSSVRMDCMSISQKLMLHSLTFMIAKKHQRRIKTIYQDIHRTVFYSVISHTSFRISCIKWGGNTNQWNIERKGRAIWEMLRMRAETKAASSIYIVIVHIR